MMTMIITEENRPVHFAFPDGDEVELPPWQYIIDRLELDLRPTINKLNLINTSLSSINTRLGVWADDQNYVEQIYQPVEYIRSDGYSYIKTDIAGVDQPLIQTVKFSLQRGFVANNNDPSPQYYNHGICGSMGNGYFDFVYTPSDGSHRQKLELQFVTNANLCEKVWYNNNSDASLVNEDDSISAFQFGSPFVLTSNSSTGVVTLSSINSDDTLQNIWTGFTRYIVTDDESNHHYLFAPDMNALAGTERDLNQKYVNIYNYSIDYGFDHYTLQPCYRVSDEKVGVVDVANNKFYPAIGTGQMFYGPAKGDTVSIIVKKEEDDS